MGARFLTVHRVCCKVGLLALFCLLAACTGRTPLQTRVVANGDTSVCTLGVMPFENWTRKSTIAPLATQVFTSELITSDAYNVVQVGEIGFFRLRQRIVPGSLLSADDYATMAEQLGVDVVVQGRVVEEGVERSHGDASPYLALNIDIYDARSGTLLLNSVHRRSGAEYRKVMHFGVVTTSSGLMQKMSQEIISDWLSKGVVCR